jgi:hypothetical protein
LPDPRDGASLGAEECRGRAVVLCPRIPALQDDRAGKGGPLGRRRVRRSLKGTAEKLLAAQRSLTHEDIERLVLTQLREEPDDEPGQPYATHSKVKVSLLSVLADVVKSKASGDSIEDLLSQL